MLDNLFKFGLVIAIATVVYRLLPSPEARKDGVVTKSVGANVLLEKHSEIFAKARIIKVTENVYVAIGFSIANMIMIEGTDGIIIVDTTENSAVAMQVFNEFRKITKKPLKGIIVTHFHADHIVGAAALVEAAKNEGVDVNVYMHYSTAFELKRFMTSADVGYRRGTRQFGVYLEHNKEHINSGIGLRLNVDEDLVYSIADATHTFEVEKMYTLAGVTFTLMHTPGETDDQLTVWIPEWAVVMPADNIYESFPNLYAIRGSPPRDCDMWYKSLDKVRRLGAKYMVPSHTKPVEGKKRIYDIITYYRDAIQFVNDQTIRYMNEGYDVDDIVELVKLPPSLKSHPYLQEYYGSVAWSVRAIYSGQLGWFDGDPANLNPLSKAKRAKKLDELLSADYGAKSGSDKMLVKADECLKKSSLNFESTGSLLRDELQWSLELSSHALKASSSGSETYEKAKQIYLDSLRALATAAPNANARNYYLTWAKELETGLVISMSVKARRGVVKDLKVEDIMAMLVYRFKAEECDENVVLTVIFEFTDVGQLHSYTMRHCILDYVTESSLIAEKFDAKLKVTSMVWKEILTNERSGVTSYATGDVIIEGSLLSFKQFMDLIKKE